MKILELIKDKLIKKERFIDKCKIVVEKLHNAFPNYNWVGIYMVEQNNLKLLTYCGDFDTDHKIIPISKGICGKAARMGQTVIVPDVRESPEYLSCSLKTKSEIVVPIGHKNNMIGEIDIDSYTLNAFSYADKIFLEEVSQILYEEYIKDLYATRDRPSNKITIRVGYRETDQMGVVYHSNYLAFFEIARTEFLRNCGIVYKEMEKEGTFLIVGDAYVKIFRSAQYDDILTIETYLSNLSKINIKFDYKIFNQNVDLVATGYSNLYPISSRTKKIKRLDNLLIEKLQKVKDLGVKNGEETFYRRG